MKSEGEGKKFQEDHCKEGHCQEDQCASEHVKPSMSREDFLNRVKDNEIKRKKAKAAGTRVCLKRQLKPPKRAFEVPCKANERKNALLL